MKKPSQRSDSFSFSELAVVGGLAKRAFQHLADAEPRVLPEGKGIRVLKRTAVIGAFVAGGVPVIAAGRLAEALLADYNQYDGEIPSGLRPMSSRLPAEAVVDMPDDAGDYWYHRALVRYSNLYTMGQALPGDVAVEIVDKAHFFSINIELPDRASLRRDDSGYSGQIAGWERGSDPVVTHIKDMLPAPDDPNFDQAFAALEANGFRIRRNATAVLTVNLSLAIRNGLDRLAQHRGLA